MDYYRLVIETTGEAAEVLAAALSHISPYCEIDDPGDVRELTQAPSPRWDYLGEELFENSGRTPTVTLYFERDEQGALLLREAEAAVRALAQNDAQGFFGGLKTRVDDVRSEDWENNWKQYYKPFTVGSRLLIRPSWEPVPPGARDRRVLTIDPASSFGTGSHATTRLCMEALDGMELSGASVLDMGCGSGILAAAAVLLGARDAVLCDIEPTAVQTAEENVRRAACGKRGRCDGAVRQLAGRRGRWRRGCAAGDPMTSCAPILWPTCSSPCAAGWRPCCGPEASFCCPVSSTAAAARSWRPLNRPACGWNMKKTGMAGPCFP